MSAWLITGGSPARRRFEALELARARLCPGHSEDPPCRDCRRIQDFLHPDFLALAPEIESGPIKIDRVREALRFASGRPYEASARVVWIEKAEALLEEGANALLKSLEEPPAFLTWILGSESRDLILPTVRSRCRLHRLAGDSAPGRTGRFRDHGVSEPDARDAAAFGLEPGDDRDLDRSREIRERTLRALASGETSALLLLAAEFADDAEWASLLAALLRDAAVLASGVEPSMLIHAGAASEIRRVSRAYPADALRRAAVEAAGLAADDRLNRNPRLSRERVLLGLRKASRPGRGIGGRRSTRGEEGG